MRKAPMDIENPTTKAGKTCLTICKALFVICKYLILAFIGICKILVKVSKHIPEQKKNLYSSYGEAEAYRQCGQADMYEYSKTKY